MSASFKRTAILSDFLRKCNSFFQKRKTFFCDRVSFLREQTSFEGRHNDHFDYNSGKILLFYIKNQPFAVRHLTCRNFSARIKIEL